MSTANVAKICLIVVTCSWPVMGAVEQGRGASKKAARASVAHEKHDDDRKDDNASYFKRHGHEKLHIPPGHYPPPGQCRIWHPGRPPGHQPPPTSCERARAQVPRGAWVIRHPADDPDHVHVTVYDDRRPGSILVVGQFKIADGIFVRVVVDR